MENVLNLQKKQPVMPTGAGGAAGSCTSSLVMCCSASKE